MTLNKNIEKPHLLQRSDQTRSSVISRAFSIMHAFQNRASTWLLDDLTDFTGLPRFTVFRLINQLVEVGWFERDHDRQGYRLGAKIVAMGEHSRNYGHIREAPHPTLNNLYLETGLVVHLGVFEDKGTIHYIDKVGEFSNTNLPSRVGLRYPAERTTAGRSMLASMTPLTAETFLVHFEDVHNINLDWLRSELPVVRRTFGISIIIGGTGSAVFNAIGAPITGPEGPVGAISVAGTDAAVHAFAPLRIGNNTQGIVNYVPRLVHKTQKAQQQDHNLASQSYINGCLQIDVR